jgi:ATP/maltotriose-dependent transcriptional regulator MalT
VRAPGLIEEAVALLDQLAPSAQLALAYSMHASFCLQENDLPAAVHRAEAAVELARAMDDAHVTAYCLNTLGCVLADAGEPNAVEPIQESLQVALENGLEDDVARGYNNLVYVQGVQRRWDDALATVDDGLRYTTDHDLNGSFLCLLAANVTMLLDLGLWDQAESRARELLYVRATSRASRMEALVALGLLHARRGDLDAAWPLIEEAADHIRDAHILGYDGVIAVARGEAHLLAGDVVALEGAVRPAYEEAVRQRNAYFLPRLALLLWRGGLLDSPAACDVDVARLASSGRHREAFAAWMAEGFTYDAAWALLDSDDEVDLREARAMFEQIGATALVERTDSRLRATGARVPRGVRASTRANVGGLTDRELDVLELLDEGLRNAEIAARLHLSEKTVGHHVSAILGKLGASSRLEAVRRARDLAAAG